MVDCSRTRQPCRSTAKDSSISIPNVTVDLELVLDNGVDVGSRGARRVSADVAAPWLEDGSIS